MHAQEDPAGSDNHGQSDRDSHDILSESSFFLDPGEQRPQGEIGHGGEHRVPAREAGGEHLGSVRDEIRPGALEKVFQDGTDDLAAKH